jgi:hypothetical protein
MTSDDIAVQVYRDDGFRVHGATYGDRYRIAQPPSTTQWASDLTGVSRPGKAIDERTLSHREPSRS